MPTGTIGWWYDGWYGQWLDTWFGVSFSGDEIIIDPSVDTPFERTLFMPALNRTLIVPALNRTLVVPVALDDFEMHEEGFTAQGGKIVKFPFKDPDELDDYKLDWTARLAPDSDDISTSAWSIVTDMTGDPSPLAIETESFTLSSTTVWLSGGTIGNTYQLLNHVVTTGGRVLEQTVQLKVKSR